MVMLLGESDIVLLALSLWGCVVFSVFYFLMMESPEPPSICGFKVSWDQHAEMCLWPLVDRAGVGAGFPKAKPVLWGSASLFPAQENAICVCLDKILRL